MGRMFCYVFMKLLFIYLLRMTWVDYFHREFYEFVNFVWGILKVNKKFIIVFWGGRVGGGFPPLLG